MGCPSYFAAVVSGEPAATVSDGARCALAATQAKASEDVPRIRNRRRDALSSGAIASPQPVASVHVNVPFQRREGDGGGPGATKAWMPCET